MNVALAKQRLKPTWEGRYIWIVTALSSVIQTNTWRHVSVNACVYVHVFVTMYMFAKTEVKNSSDDYVYVCWGGLWNRFYESGCGDEDWIQLVQDRDQWRIFVSTEIWKTSAFVKSSKYFAHVSLFALRERLLHSIRCVAVL
jgi:hypothetical protein